MYLTFDYYTANGGKVASSAFPPLEKQAEYKVDYWTQDRLKALATIPDSVKDLMVIMINDYNDFNELEVKNVTSFSNDGVSVSFGEGITLKTIHDKLYDLAVEMLPIELISAVVE